VLLQKHRIVASYITYFFVSDRVPLCHESDRANPPPLGVPDPRPPPFLGGRGGTGGGLEGPKNPLFGASNALETTKKSRKIGILAPPKRDGGRDGGKISAEIPSLEFSARY